MSSKISYYSDDDWDVEVISPAARVRESVVQAATAAINKQKQSRQILTETSFGSSSSSSRKQISRISVAVPAPAKTLHLLQGQEPAPKQQQQQHSVATTETRDRGQNGHDDNDTVATCGSANTKRSASSTTPTVKSPYEVSYCAEDHQPIFQETEERLGSMNCTHRKLENCVRQSKLLYSSTWLTEGVINDLHVGIPDPSSLVLCLNKWTFGKADVFVLKKLSQELGFVGLVQKLVTTMRLEDRYPKMATRPSSLTALLLAPKKEVLKSLLFLSRVYCAKQFLNTSFDGDEDDDDGDNLAPVVHRCLDICETNACVSVTSNKKKRGRKKKASLQGRLDDEDAGGGLEDGGGLAKRRRVSEPDMKEDVTVGSHDDNANAAADVGDGPDLTTNGILNRFDELEDYFRNGLRAVQQLRKDVERKEEVYKNALTLKAWGTPPSLPASASDPESRGDQEGE